MLEGNMRDYRLEFKTDCKSIKSLENVQLPPFSIICGPNGSGKSQLLEAIKGNRINAVDLDGRALRVEVFQSAPSIVAPRFQYQDMEARNEISEAMHNLVDALEDKIINGALQVYAGEKSNSTVVISRENALQALSQFLRGKSAWQLNAQEEKIKKILDRRVQLSGAQKSMTEAIRTLFSPRALANLESYEAEKVKKALVSFVQHQAFMKINVSAVLYTYYHEWTDNNFRKSNGSACLSEEEFEMAYGKKPWEEINALLHSYGFKHQIIAPDLEKDPKAIKGFQAQFIDDDKNIISVGELSSGEKVIIALLLSAYAVQQSKDNFFELETPDLILFDELDAHLHPRMARMMLDVLNNKVTELHGARVVVTTHSPSTVALAPIGSVFKLTANGGHKLSRIDREVACQELCEGFIQVMDNSQIVIVEGRDDPIFYRAICTALRSGGYLPDTPPLHFIAASKTVDPSHGGGVSSAIDWAEKLSQTILPNIHALLDEDGKRQSNGNLKVLQGRWAIENFILDPMSLAITLIVDQKLQELNADLAAIFPTVNSILLAEEAKVQSLLNIICERVEAQDPTLANDRPAVEIEYLCGKKLQIPEWVCKRRGKSLKPIVQEAFKNGSKREYVITKENLNPLLRNLVQYPALFPASIRESFLQFEK